MGGFSVSEKAPFVVTCEHGGNRIPERYATFFSGQDPLLGSHRGWDPGALPLARTLARRLVAPLFFSTVSRLLVDLNRSIHHPRLFSDITGGLPLFERQRILERWYHPYRQRVTATMEEVMGSGAPVVHLSIHTFTPVLKGDVRQVEIGLLYDPSRERERGLCQGLKRDLSGRLSSGPDPLRIRMNQPYQGRSDGFTTWLRKQYPPEAYLGIEVEVNQGLIFEREEAWGVARGAILRAFEALMEGDPQPTQTPRTTPALRKRSVPDTASGSRPYRPATASL